MLSDREKEEQLQFRDHWFPDHVATRFEVEGGEGLRWAKPDTVIFSVVYVRLGGTLMVSGDIGSAVYRWHPKGCTLRWIAGCNLGYFESKCEASESGRDYRDWDSELCRLRAEGHLRDDWEDDERSRGDDGRFRADKPLATLRERWEWPACTDSRQEWVAFLGDVGDEIFGCDHWEFTPGLGDVISQRCHGHLYGLKMACEQMELAEGAA